MDAAPASDHWSRCWHCLRLLLPLHLYLIPCCSSQSQWDCNDHTGSCIRDGGRQDFMTARRSGSASNAGCGPGYNAIRWVCLQGSSGCWCTRHGGSSIYWLLLCSRRGGSHRSSDICNGRIVQGSLGGDNLTMDCRGYRTPFLRAIPLTSQYRNVSLSRWKLKIPRRSTLLLILIISKTSNIS